MSVCGVNDSACTQKSVRLYCGVGENARWRNKDILAAAVTVVEKGNSSGQEVNAHLKMCTCRVGASWPTPPRHHRPGRRLTRTASKTALWTALRPAGRARCLAWRFIARRLHRHNHPSKRSRAYTKGKGPWRVAVAVFGLRSNHESGAAA